MKYNGVTQCFEPEFNENVSESDRTALTETIVSNEEAFNTSSASVFAGLENHLHLKQGQISMTGYDVLGKQLNSKRAEFNRDVNARFEVCKSLFENTDYVEYILQSYISRVRCVFAEGYNKNSSKGIAAVEAYHKQAVNLDDATTLICPGAFELGGRLSDQIGVDLEALRMKEN
jgi:hypothetical protein